MSSPTFQQNQNYFSLLDTFRKVPHLWLALDKGSEQEKLEILVEVAQHIDAIKINDDMVAKIGLKQALKPFLRFGLPIFADLKMFKGSRTMVETALEAAEAGATFVNAYALAERLLEPVVKALEGSGTRILVNTVLTHMDEDYCLRFFRRNMFATVQMFSKVATNVGAYGVICPAGYAKAVEDPKLHIASPGIRSDWKADSNEQRSAVSPEEAVRNGANILICGSAVVDFPREEGGPKEAIRRIKEKMNLVV